MKMHHFPRMSDVVQGLHYLGYVGPTEDITGRIFLSTLAVEHLTGVSLFHRQVRENLVVEKRWLYLSAYNISDFSTVSEHILVEEINPSICAVKIENHTVSAISRMLNTVDGQEIEVDYSTGYKDGELPSLYQELILNIIYYNVLSSAYRNDKVESEINRLLEIARASKTRFERDRFSHMVDQGIV